MAGRREFSEAARFAANDTITTLDGRSVEALYRAHGEKVRRRAAALMRNRDAADDVTQEVFLRAFGARALLTSADAELGWLYRITTNLCLNRLRDVRRRDHALVSRAPHDEATSRSAVDAALTLRSLMRNVPPALQEMAVWYFVDEMTQKELSLRLKVPRRTVGYRLEQFRILARATPAAQS